MRLRNKIRKHLKGELAKKTNTELGLIFGVNRITMNCWLSGKRSPKDPTIRAKISELLKVPESKLFYYGD